MDAVNWRLSQTVNDIGTLSRTPTFDQARLNMGLAGADLAILRTDLASCGCPSSTLAVLEDARQAADMAQHASTHDEFFAQRRTAIAAFNRLTSALTRGSCRRLIGM